MRPKNFYLKRSHMNAVRTRGVYPGTFDPVTFGHIDLIERALKIFDEVIVAVAHQSADKDPLFTVKERVALLKKATADMGGQVTVEDFDGLVVDYARRKKASSMIRGVRMISDFEYEFQMALTNRKLAGDVETIFLMPHESYAYISSRLVKQVVLLGGDITPFVPKFVLEATEAKYRKKS